MFIALMASKGAAVFHDDLRELIKLL